jgi:hypothetical protein
MKLVITLAVLCLTFAAQAQSSAVELIEVNSVVAEVPSAESIIEKKREYFTVMVAVYPLPIAIGGGTRGSSLAAELKPFRNVTAHLAASSIIKENEDSGFNIFGEETKIENKTLISSIRIYSQPTHCGWYLGIGYLNGETDVNYSPPLFGGLSASRSKNLHGATAAIGYRFEGGEKSYGTWMVDVGVSYEPTRVSDIKYSGSIDVFSGNSSGDVKFKTEYGIEPSARAGLSF